MVLLDLGNPFYAKLGRAIEDRLTEAGCVMLACSTDVSADRESHLLDLLEEQSVRGIILAPVDPDLSRLARIAGRGTPVVLLDHPIDALRAVSVDNRLDGRLAAQHLVDRGHRRIAMLTGAVAVRPVTDRRTGICDALRDAGLDPAEAGPGLRRLRS